MTSTSPALTTSVFVPKTCARRVSAFRGARGKDGRGKCALILFRLEPGGTVIFAHETSTSRTRG